MDAVLQSNIESAILTGLSADFVTNLAYRLDDNYPNLSKQIVIVPPNVQVSAGAPWSTSVIFSIPRVGILNDMFVNTSFVVSGTSGSYTNMPTFTQNYDCGLSLYESIELRSRNRILCSNTDIYIRCRVYNAPAGLSLAYQRMSKIQPVNALTITGPVGSTPSVTVLNVWTPVFFSFMESIKEGLDLTFVENLQLYCNFNTAVRSGWGAATLNASAVPTAVLVPDPTSVNVSLYMRYYNLTNSEWAKLKSSNFRRDSPSQFLIYDTIMETPYVNVSQAANTSITLNLTVNNCVTATHILTVTNGQVAGNCGIMPADCTVPGFIDAVGFKLMGKYIWQSIGYLGLTLERNRFGASDLCFGANTSVGSYGYVPIVQRLNGPISIFWGLDKSHSFNSGAISLHSRNSPQLILTQNLNPSTTSTIYVCHEVLSILSVDGLSSAITVSTGL